MRKSLSAIFFVLLIASCKSQQLPLKQIETYGIKSTIDDSVLNMLQKTNELVLVYSNLNFAWARSSGYYILANNKGKWIGILYGKSNTAVRGSGLPQKPVSYDTFAVSQISCDSILQYFQEHEIWKLNGDGDNSSSKCNTTVNDAPAWRLMIITKKAYTDATFNAPEIYQEHCPDDSRRLFIEACKKIKEQIDKIMDKMKS